MNESPSGLICGDLFLTKFMKANIYTSSFEILTHFLDCYQGIWDQARYHIGMETFFLDLFQNMKSLARRILETPFQLGHTLFLKYKYVKYCIRCRRNGLCVRHSVWINLQF